MQGIGSGGLVTMVEVVITDMVPLAERGGYFSILALVWAIGSVVGKAPYVLSNSPKDPSLEVHLLEQDNGAGISNIRMHKLTLGYST